MFATERGCHGNRRNIEKNTISSYFKYKLQVITEVSVTQRFNNPIKNILYFQN